MKKNIPTTYLWRLFLLGFVGLQLLTFNLKAQQLDSLSLQTKDSLFQIKDSLVSKDTAVISPQKEFKGKITLEGQLRDYTTSEPLSFATLFFPNTAVGMRSDIDGKFKFELAHVPGDTIYITLVGYAKKKVVINKSLPYQYLKLELERASIEIKNVVFKYDKNPGLTLVKKVIKAKPINNYDKAENYYYEVYNKLEMDINKIPKKAFRTSPILKKFNFVQNFMDSTSEEKPFLPLFLTETISDYYYQKKPKKMKEFIKGSRISGYKNQSVSQMLGSMYQNINIYDNSIPIFDVPFVSPIANDAPSFYKYEITDTQYFNNKLCYQVAFSPKRSGEHTFNGDFWIHDTDFAVQKINMIVTKEQNINWVNKVTMMQEFTCFEDTLWFLTRDKFYVDFLPPHGDKIAGFLGRKTTTYKNIVVNKDSVNDVVNDKHNRADTKLDAEALNRNEDYWNSVRHDSLSKNEKAIYRMIDTIQGLPIYKKYYSIFYLLGTGIKEFGPIEIGSVYNLYSSNVIEGARYRFNIGTTPKLFKNIYIRGYVAYGTKDERFKYMGSALWIINKKPRMFVYAEYKHDLDNSVNQYDDAKSIDNIFSSIGRKANVPWKLAFVDKQRLEFYNRYYNGFSHLLSIERRAYTPYAPLPSQGVIFKDGNVSSNTVNSTEIGLELRFAHKEQFVEGNYYVTSLGTKSPILKLYIGQSFKHLLGSNYQYTKFRFTLSDYYKIKRMGLLYYNIFVGKTIGTLPYSLLEIHPGNEFYYYASHSFNMMYRYEYLSDQYIGAITEHSLGSLFFKYIPYVKEMKIRAFWNAKGVYGSLSDANQQLNLNKGYLFQTLSKSPYLEVGTGLENIFKVLRVDCVWRLLPYRTVADHPTRRFGVFGSMKFSF